MSRKAVLIPEAKIERRLKISEGTFKDLYTYTSPALKSILPNGKLPVVRKGSGGRGGFDYFCDERYVKLIEDIPCLEDGRVKCYGKIWLTGRKANSDFGISQSYLQQYTTADRNGKTDVVPELGRCLKTITFVVRDENLFRFRKLTLFNEGDCAEIQKARERHEEADGDETTDRNSEAPAAKKLTWRTTGDLLNSGYSEYSLKKYVREDGTGTSRRNRRNSSGKINHVRLWNDIAIERLDKTLERFSPANGISDKQASTESLAPTTIARWRKQKKLRFWRIDIRTGKEVPENKWRPSWRFHVIFNHRKQLMALKKRRESSFRDSSHSDAEGTFDPLSVLAGRHNVGAGLLFNWLRWCPWLKRPLLGKEIERIHKKIPNGMLLVAHREDAEASVKNWRNKTKPIEPWPLPPSPSAIIIGADIGTDERASQTNGIQSDGMPSPHVQSPTANAELTDRRRNLLQAMGLLKAFSFETRVKLSKIVKKAESNLADPDNFKHDMAYLSRIGLIKTRKSRGGGSWLTAHGISLLEKLGISAS